MTILIFNPHSPYGERLLLADLKTKRHTFQSTLPMRGATGRTGWKIGSVLFQSTLPMRGATSDCLRTTRSRWNFNPHSPCGERLLLFVRMYFGTLFQSTLPMRGATHVYALCRDFKDISIHTPHAGSDLSVPAGAAGYYDFNPHSPCGERLLYVRVIM